MEFEVRTTCFFKSQVEGLDEKSRRIILDKFQLIKLNPFRYKCVESKEYSRVHRVRLTVNDKSVRMVYVIIGNIIWVVCLIDREKDYANLDDYLKRHLGELSE